jgi:MFS transporter, MHS family, proline/betaine transporter
MSRFGTGQRSQEAVLSSRSAVLAICVGNAVQWYDFALYGAFASIIGPVFFPAEDISTVMLAAFAVYGTALIVRPVGAVIFGRMADARGRRAVLLPVLILMAGATAAIGVLPGYAVIGLLAPLILIVLRAGQGLAAGGELGVAGVLIVEGAPGGRRGEMASWHTATIALGLGFGMAVASVLLFLGPSDPVDSGWWRFAFILALPMGLVAGYVRRRVSETSHFLAVSEAGQLASQPIPTLWVNHRPALLRGFGLIAAGSLAFNTFFIFTPNHVSAAGGRALSSVLLVSAAVLVVTAAAAVALGRISDVVGRRPVALWSAAALAVLATPMSVVAHASTLGLVVAQLAMGVALAGVLSVAMVGELFGTPLRSTGMALTAGLATALVGGTAPAVDQILVTSLNLELAPGLYVSLVGCLALIGLWRWPETAFSPTV